MPVLTMLASALAATVLAGCETAAGAGDSNLDNLAAIPLVDELRLGHVEDPELGFSAIGPVAVDDDGNVYVVEMQDLEIRVFDPAGNPLRKIGRAGEGPGEFMNYPRIWVLGDTLWALESGSVGRISLFTRDGDHVWTSAPIEGVYVGLQTDMNGVVRPRDLAPDGTFIGDMTLFTSRGPETLEQPEREDTVRVPRVRFDRTGAAIDTIGYDLRPPPGESTPRQRIEIGGVPYVVPQPLGDGELSVPLSDGRVFVDRTAPSAPGIATISVTRLGLNRDTLIHRVFEYEARRFTEAYLDSVTWRGVRLRTGGYRVVNGQPVYPDMPENADAIYDALRAAMDFPEFMPLLLYAEAGRDGSIWLMASDDGSLEQGYYVLDSDLNAVGKVVVPRGARPMWMTLETMWVIERDDYDVPWLVKYRLDTG